MAHTGKLGIPQTALPLKGMKARTLQHRTLEKDMTKHSAQSMLVKQVWDSGIVSEPGAS